MISIKKQIRSDLHILLAITAILTTIGMLFIYSSSSVYAIEKFGKSYYYVLKQLAGLVLGIAALIVARLVPIQLIKKMSPLLFFGSLVLTAMTLIPQLSSRIHGSSRWLSIGGFGFQPSELLKIALILYLA